jgi:hypothetical protein
VPSEPRDLEAERLVRRLFPHASVGAHADRGVVVVVETRRMHRGRLARDDILDLV